MSRELINTVWRKLSANKKTNHNHSSNQIVITSHDIKAVSGGDIFATELDLARAYYEMGKYNLAKKILLHVAEKGSGEQQLIALDLLEALESCS